MPKIGAPAIRKSALIAATIRCVGEAGTLDVTVAEIAKLAGMSPALAHHYFGSKSQIFLAAMRHILTRFRDGVRAEVLSARDDRARLDALIRASFGPESFGRNTVSAWLNFYTLAQVNPQAARLLRVYHRRLQTNVTVLLRRLGAADPAEGAATIGALIDGVYIRAALSPGPTDATAAIRIVNDYLRKILP